MGWVQIAIRTLFAFSVFVILFFLQFFMQDRVESRSWLFGVLLAAACASLAWVLYRESQASATTLLPDGKGRWNCTSVRDRDLTGS